MRRPVNPHNHGHKGNAQSSEDMGRVARHKAYQDGHQGWPTEAVEADPEGLAIRLNGEDIREFHKGQEARHTKEHD